MLETASESSEWKELGSRDQACYAIFIILHSIGNLSNEIITNCVVPWVNILAACDFCLNDQTFDESRAKFQDQTLKGIDRRIMNLFS
jgi:hypothetical protein